MADPVFCPLLVTLVLRELYLSSTEAGADPAVLVLLVSVSLLISSEGSGLSI
jgi:hypothetical protein